MDPRKLNPPSKLNEPGWRRNFISAFRRSLSEKTKTAELKMNNVLHNDPPSPEDVTLTTGTFKKKKKAFEIFHWKFILWSVLFVFGLCGTTIMWFTSLYQDEIFKRLTLGNGTKLHFAWKNPPLEPLLCVHVFNYTNLDEFFSNENKKSKSVKLKVEDVGPYCYRETIERQYIKFRNNETEMSYREQRLHRWDMESSVGSPDDTVVVPNVLMLTVFKEIHNKSAFERFTFYAALSVMGAKPFVTTTVEKYLFGYEDEVFNMLGSAYSTFGGNSKKFS